jgi:hypothetical protein
MDFADRTFPLDKLALESQLETIRPDLFKLWCLYGG